MSEQAGGIATLREVRATFARADQMQDAVSKLSMSGFDRADMSLPSPGLIDGTETPEEGAKPVSTESDARQARTLGASTAASAAALAAAGIVVATGGAALPAVAAAVVAGGAVGGSVAAIGKAATGAEQSNRDERATTGQLILSVRVPTDAKRAEAEVVLRQAGATDVEFVA